MDAGEWPSCGPRRARIVKKNKFPQRDWPPGLPRLHAILSTGTLMDSARVGVREKNRPALVAK